MSFNHICTWWLSHPFEKYERRSISPIFRKNPSTKILEVSPSSCDGPKKDGETKSSGRTDRFSCNMLIIFGGPFFFFAKVWIQSQRDLELLSHTQMCLRKWLIDFFPEGVSLMTILWNCFSTKNRKIWEPRNLTSNNHLFSSCLQCSQVSSVGLEEPVVPSSCHEHPEMASVFYER